MKVSVNQGDTLHKLLRDRGVPENKLQQASEQVAELNNLESPDLIRAGSTLVFPDTMSFGAETISLDDAPSAYAHLAAQGTATSGQAMGAMGRFALQTTRKEARQALDANLRSLFGALGPDELKAAIKDANTLLDSDAAKQLEPDETAQLRSSLALAESRFEDVTGLGQVREAFDFDHRVSPDARFSLSTSRASGTDTANNMDGEPVQFSWNTVALNAEDKANSEYVTLESNEGDLEGWRADFQESAGDWVTGWDLDVSYSPAGDLGNMVSAQRVDESYMGGAHPNANSQYRTFNAATGERVHLSQLLTPDEMSSVVDKATKTFRTHPEVDAFIWDGSSPQDLREGFDENFALFMDGGRPKIAVGQSHSIEAARGIMLEAVLDAPCTPEFFAKVGLDHAKAASEALFAVADAGLQLDPAVPYKAIGSEGVEGWFRDFFGGDASKLSPAQRESAASALEDVAPGASMGERTVLFDMAEQIRAGDYEVRAAGIDFNQDEEAFFKSRDVLWGNSFFIDSGFDHGPASRYDFEPNGKVTGWKLSMGDEITRQRFEGEYKVFDDGTVSIVTANGDEDLKLNFANGEYGVTKDGQALSTRPDYGATPEDEPSVALLERPFFAPAMGAYGHTAKLTFDPGGDFHGWRQAYSEAEDIHQEPVDGKWSFDNGKITLELDEAIDGKTTFHGKLTDDGPRFPDSPFADMTSAPEFWDA